MLQFQPLTIVSIWDNWFVISFTDIAANIAKPFIPLSLLRRGEGTGGWVLYVNF